MHLKLEEQIKRGLESKTFSDIEKAGIPGLDSRGRTRSNSGPGVFTGQLLNPRKGEGTDKSGRKNKIRTKINSRKK